MPQLLKCRPLQGQLLLQLPLASEVVDDERRPGLPGGEREALVLEYPVGQGRLVPVLVALAEGGGLNVVDGHPGQSADVTHPAVEGCGRRVEAADPVLLIQEKNGVVQTGGYRSPVQSPGRLLRLPLPSRRRLLGGQSGPLIDEDADQPPLIKEGFH